jgi:hypothetical protein
MKWLVAAVVAAAVLAVPQAARAGATYQVQSCGAAHGSAAFALANPTPTTIESETECPPIAGRWLTGISLATTDADTPARTTAAWTIGAPAGTVLRRLEARRSFGKRDSRWSPRARTAEGTVLETCAIAPGESECLRQPETVVYDGLDTRAVAFELACSSSLPCPGRELPRMAWMAVHSAVATVEDLQPPGVEPLDLPSGWRAGVENVRVTARDGSGVRSVALTAAGVRFAARTLECDYSRMRPCPESWDGALQVDTARVSDGTHELKATVTDAAQQPGTATALLRVDRTAPTAPTDLRVARNGDGTLALTWTNPDQGTAAPIAAARYQVCNAAGGDCAPSGRVPGSDRIGSAAVPAGEHLVRVWLEDEAGHADRDNAAGLIVDPNNIASTRVVDTLDPVLSGSGVSPRLRITRARRSGSRLILSGTISRGATARVTARLARTRSGRTVASARVKPRRGKWSLRVRLTPRLRRAGRIYLTVSYPGEATHRRTTLQRRLARRAGSTAFRVVSVRSTRR